MPTKKIISANAAYQHIEVLKSNRNKRYKSGEFFIEGVRNINEAVKNKWHIVSLCYTAERSLSGWAYDIIEGVKTDINYELTAVLLDNLSGKDSPSEIIAIAKMREDGFTQLKTSLCPMVALFDRPSNKGNLGTIIRSCDAFGFDGLILTGHAVDLYDPEVIIASMGSFFNVPCIRIADYIALFEYINTTKTRYPSFRVIGTTAHKETIISDVDMTVPSLIMIGNETDGLSRVLKESCDILATIPMAEKSSASSFNVACAATTVFYEAMRQRNFK
ncbi:MAG: TrmH family RNA methyltransferase [Eubacteriales bacterium]